MIKVGAALSSNPSIDRAVEEAAGGAMARAGVDRADLAIVFFTVDYLSDHERLSAALIRATGTDRIVGCSGAGVLTSQGEIEGGSGLAVLVLSSDRIQGHPFLSHPTKGRDLEAGQELVRNTRTNMGENSLLVLFTDPYSARPGQLLEGVGEGLESLPVVGAGCSENGGPGKNLSTLR